ncbi:glutathione S-transferase [Rhodovulum sp. DZ06]|uniref:glutathione S-transferase n=1 Tax=Rhodovulum sp. DZ06 TaxID=3425126 RepID=UPI003D324E90
MPDTLFIQERTLSSWSLRGHLLMDIAGRSYTPRLIPGGKGFHDRLPPEIAPATTVPALQLEDGPFVWDTLAIAETLAEMAPDRPLWPADRAARAFARAITAEMHSGYGALRDACSMNITLAFEGFEVSEAVRKDVDRLEERWAMARARFGEGGPWLFGAEFTAADAFMAPLATRLLTYGIPVGAVAQAYCAAVVNYGPFRRWRAMGLAEGPVPTRYDLPLPKAPWPGPAPRPAKALAEGEVPVSAAVNAACPYSGKPVAADSLAEIDGKVIGFCNTFCRDKSVADADAWPKLAPLLA